MMAPVTLELATKSKPRAALPPLGEVLGWHVAWALGVVIGGGLIALTGLTEAAIGALLLALVPPVLAQALLKFDGQGARTGLLALWSACVSAACALAGGLSGPLTPWLLAPLGVAGVLGRSRMLARGAAFSVGSAVLVALLQLMGLTGPAMGGALDAALAALALLTTALGLGTGLILARRSDKPAEDPTLPRTVLNGQAHLVAVADADGKVTAHFGPAPKGVIRSRLADGIERAARDGDQAFVRDAFERARQVGAASVAFVAAGGDDRFIEMDLRRLEDGRVVASLRDATAQRDREEALENARAEAESVAQGRSRFLAGMSHELRTPLNAIMGFSDVMRQRMFGDLPGKYVEYADLIHESGAHLLDLINDVLDMSKIEAQRYELTLEEMDAREPVQAALRIVRMQADEAGVKLRAALPPQGLEVEADRRAIKQIVINLVSNAVKFTPQGGSVTVGLAARGRDLELVVADTGVGISPEDLKRIGRPYEQAGDADKKARGTGLGLSLVRALAELHGGEMTIESRLGAGTAVTVRLPVICDAQKPAPATGENVVAFKTR